MSTLKVTMPVMVLMLGLVVLTSSIYGTTDYAKKEKKSCTSCHVKVVSDKVEMGKNLTETGTCYKDNDHSLAKCAAPKK